ncbi:MULTISPECIES: 2-oxo-tetronate isomerase [unclassified Undibacterium]|uniref:2-oxo-tetronate isomerase n=2 Tax=Pseudomonadota TaxID=1224 RepID=UPI002AC8F47D|nr:MULTISPECIES: 2-oxo-tetronate isomerase [unclassified Undibacterium]MEB0140125.1 hydroxypyruvate isomerase family protein [Undibacterium sp. CCC2.1]MEB0173607.1 hydroxypyruvate isomerase family protein [Undibacterium sp. CCC1.1]MEB0177536.1 hydroxypyruvate isomerase family protein [Undibacterium sp. CCC3.4]MEB0214460.1 hydroxypyruvate isomerase family protein [Undibacterium sp. 5I2]WPX42857.1 hydroxypyruvate isomerase family protein [Undibacterium sp. CCC3.4]
MPKFAANLSMMYAELPFMERFAAAAKDGFSAVEYLFPYEYAAADLAARLAESGLQQVLFNAPPGDWAAGERGIAAQPGREDEFKRGFERALEYARVLGNRQIHVMSGMIAPQFDMARQQAVYLSNLAHAALLASRENITVLIEPINTRDMPAYFLQRQEQAQRICEDIGVSHLQVQFDIYHCQIMEGDVSSKLQRDMHRPHAGIGHVQIAGVPARQEPDRGELNYPHLFALLDELDYRGWVGCEYRPRAGTSAGLAWLRPWLG